MSEPEETLETLKIKLDNEKKSKAGSDRAYLAAAKKIAELQKELEAFNDMRGLKDSLYQRIEKIEKGYQEKEKRLELTFYSKGKCLDCGIDYSLVKDIPFRDQQHVDEHLSGLVRFIEDRKVEEVNRRLLSSELPKSGSNTKPAESNLARELSGVNLPSFSGF